MSANNFNFTKIIKNASKTFYIASLFFPKNIRHDVYVLYAFLRVSDDLVDSVPPKASEFKRLRKNLETSLAGKMSGDIIVDSFADLSIRRGIDKKTIFDYLDIQEIDLEKRSYDSYEELDKFIYGVAGVVGLMMAKIIGLREESFTGAMKLASAMQNVNIIRDISEDLLAGKIYLPQCELKNFGLPSSLSIAAANKYPEEYRKFINFQLSRARKLLTESRDSFRFIPQNSLLPIKIAADVYENVIKRISEDPLSIFYRKMKPKFWTIIKISLKNYFL